eukprot:345468-Chlamydomonas_euryale.AAC.1
MLALPAAEPELASERSLTEGDRSDAAVCAEVLSRCCFEDVFTDSKFLKQDSLVHLVKVRGRVCVCCLLYTSDAADDTPC